MAIRAIRNAKGCSVRDLAQAIGISASYLAQIERGEKRAEGIVPRIAHALAVPEDAITGKDVTVTTATEPDADEELRLYTPDEVAELWRISKSWLQKAAAQGSIECTYLDLVGSKKGVLRLSRAQIKKILASSTRLAA